MTPLKFVIGIFLFWLILGGLMQLGDSSENLETDYSTDYEDVGVVDSIYNLFTFNVVGIPQYLRWSLSVFMGFSLSLAIYVLIRGQ